MKLEFRASFDDLMQMLEFTNKLGGGTAGTSLQTVLDRINQMANTQVADLITTMQGNFASLNAEQARGAAALDRMIAMIEAMPARIQEAVDAAVANGVDEGQLAALTALAGDVQAEVDEARMEADKLEAVAPATNNPNPNPEPAPVTPDVTPPAPAPVDPNAPAPAPVTPVDGGSDTTGGGAPVPTPGA